MAHVKKTLSLDDRSAKLLEKYANELHISQSALVSMFVSQMHQAAFKVVQEVGTEDELELFQEQHSTGPLGDA